MSIKTHKHLNKNEKQKRKKMSAFKRSARYGRVFKTRIFVDEWENTGRKLQ